MLSKKWMMLSLILWGLFLPCTLLGTTPVDWVDPLIDTHESRWFYFNSASRPFGLVNLSPDTQTKGSWKSGYLYGDKNIRCFSHIHAWQLSGVPVMPIVGEMTGHLGMDTYQSSFSHDDEVVQVGYHRVVLQKYGITAELTSTTRVGLHRYTYPSTRDAYILFDLTAYLGHGPVVEAEVEFVNKREIAGMSLMKGTNRRKRDTPVYFVAQFSQDMTAQGWWGNGQPKSGSKAIEGKDIGAYARFHTSKHKPIVMKVAISYTSIEGARKNLQAECPQWDFDRVVAESKDEWNTHLSRIKVEGGTAAQKTKFYTDLWRSLLGRRIANDADGTYCDMTREEGQIRRIPLDAAGKPAFNMHNFDSLWSSHWSLSILWPLLCPERYSDFCNTSVTMYKNGGLMPRGPSGMNYTFVMIGDASASFITAAYSKGIRDFDYKTALEGLVHNTGPTGGRYYGGYAKKSTLSVYEEYQKKGYISWGNPLSGGHGKAVTSLTLYNAYHDWCIAQLAKALGRTDIQQQFLPGAQNYRHVIWPEKKSAWVRLPDGSWLPDFTPTAEVFEQKGFCETSAAVTTFYVPHDTMGLAQLLGGPAAAADQLNAQFEEAESHKFHLRGRMHGNALVDYANEDGAGMAHYFNRIGYPWLSQKWVRAVHRDALSGTDPYNGYNGDEDQGKLGTLSALMALGLFQYDGGCSLDSRYDITAPIFDKVTISLNQNYYPGKTFTIVARNQAPENVYIQSATWNGKPLQTCTLAHSELVLGGTLELELGPEPNKSWGGGSKRPKVVCFGDSITKRGYTKIMGDLLDVDTVMAGVAGNSTAQALRRMKKDVLVQEPDVVVIFFGTNDLRVDAPRVHVPIDQYRKNLETMIEACRDIKAKVVLCTLPPINTDVYFTRHDKAVYTAAGGLASMIANYRQAAMNVASQRSIPVVDLNQLLLKTPEWMHRDGVHPSPTGNSIIAKHIAKAVQPLLSQESITVTSPDGKNVFKLTQSEGIGFTIHHQDREVVGPSLLQLASRDINFKSPWSISKVKIDTVDNQWTTRFGELSEVPDKYNQVTIELKSDSARLNLICRAYNEGIAFAYEVPTQKGLKSIELDDELIDYRFAADYPLWSTPERKPRVLTAQGDYQRIPISALKPGCERPLVIEMGEDLIIALAEAKLVDYARISFDRAPGIPYGIRSSLDGRMNDVKQNKITGALESTRSESAKVTKTLPFQSPWRVVMIAENPGQLLEQNYLIQNLNDPSAIKDETWIVPGKVLRETTLTTQGGMAAIDFVASHNMQYVHFDAGWYGNEMDNASDATTITLDPKRSKGPFDIQAITRYAHKKGVKVMLYVNRRALERQLDELLPLYKEWGIDGLKFGFVRVGDQDATAWLHEAVKKAADYQMIVDVHDEYRPSGFSRTYPNLLTQEGIRGDETTVPNEHTLITMFTRMLAGAADNTICYYNKRVLKMGSHASQLAKAVCMFSPLQFLYWYDRPLAAPVKDDALWGDTKHIGNEPELAFFNAVPTTWDETCVLEAEIGEIGIIARRQGSEWYVGGINGTTERAVTVDFSFLEEGVTYRATLYTDDKNVRTRTHVKIEEKSLKRGDSLKLNIKANNGFAMRLVP